MCISMRHLLFYIPLLLSLAFSMQVEAKKKKYPNGDYYEGKWKKGSPHGLGTMYYANGDTYKGYWVFGIKEGNGTMTYKNNIKLLEYTGEWKSDKPNGEGIMHYKNGDTYKGFWNLGMHEGQGTMIFKSNVKYASYNGEWKSGKQNGQGTAIFRNGDKYEGHWDMGDISGGGVLIYTNGDVFTGNWQGKERYGDLKKIDGSWYKGEWNDDVFLNGQCYINTIGSQFEGEIKNGNYYNGKGKINKGKDYYNGVWEDGKFIGDCKITFTDYVKSSFTGNVKKDGSMNGIIEYKNNKSYIGDISCEYIPDGTGTLVHKINNYCSYEINSYWDNGNIFEFNNGYVTIEPIKTNNIFISEKQKIPLNMVNGELLYYNTYISNQYDEIADNIKIVTDSIVENIKEQYINSNLKTFRTENYKLCKEDRKSQGLAILYFFDDAEYQKDPFTNQFHGKFHLWNGKYDSGQRNIYSVQGQYKQGKKEGKWIYERRNTQGELTGRLIINYKNNLKSGVSTLEIVEEDGSKAIIKAYYDNDHWNNKGKSYYSYIYDVDINIIPFFYSEERVTIKENKITFDKDGKFHGNIFMKLDDVELSGEFSHGKLLNMKKRNIKKNVELTPINGKEEFNIMWKLTLPAQYNIFSNGSDFRFDADPFIGLTLIDLTAEGKDYKPIYSEAKNETNY